MRRKLLRTKKYTPTTEKVRKSPLIRRRIQLSQERASKITPIPRKKLVKIGDFK